MPEPTTSHLRPRVPPKITAKEMIASFVIGTPKIKRSAPSRIKGLAFLITVRVESVVYILGDDCGKHNHLGLCMLITTFLLLSHFDLVGSNTAFACHSKLKHVKTAFSV